MTVGIFPYEGREQLPDLRAKHDSTHVFRRESEEILAVPYVHKVPRLGTTFRTVRLTENLDLCAALVRNGLVNYLHGLPRKLFRHRPVVFLADKVKDNFLKECVPNGTVCPDWLAVVPLYEVEVRVFHFEDMEPFVGVCLNVRTRKFLDRPCNRLLSEGFPLVGHYVGRKVKSNDSRLEPYFRLQGRVQAVEGNNLILDDNREGEDCLDVAEAFLEPKRRAFDALVRHVFKRQGQPILDALAGKLAAHQHGPERLKKLRAICGYLNKNPLTILPNVTCQPLQLLAEGNHSSFPAIEQPPPVVYVFDQAGEKSGTHQDQGLDDFGPYTARTLSPSKPRFCVICQSSHKGRVEQFVRKFLEGITLQGQQRNPFGKGFIRKYAFKDVLLDFFEASNGTAAAYHKAVKYALLRNETVAPPSTSPWSKRRSDSSHFTEGATRIWSARPNSWATRFRSRASGWRRPSFPTLGSSTPSTTWAWRPTPSSTACRGSSRFTSPSLTNWSSAWACQHRPGQARRS